MISQKIGAQSQAFNSFAAYYLHKTNGEIKMMTNKHLIEIMGIVDQRRHIRLKKNIQVTLQKRVPDNLELLLKGNTIDLSQCSSFIKTGGWHLFKSGELMELTFFFPMGFSGEDAPIGLQGSAIVRRVDKLREGIAVEFINELRHFKQIVVC